MAMITMTFGEMPTREQFDEACARRDPESGRSVDDDGFGFGNDPVVGTDRLTPSELWKLLCDVHVQYSAHLCGDDDGDPEVLGSWLSSVLGCLGFEWV